MAEVAVIENTIVALPPSWSRPVLDAEEKQPTPPSARSEPKKVAEAEPAEPAQPEFARKVASGNEEAIRRLAESINRFMEDMNYSLQFVLDKETETIVVKVLDGEGNLIRRIPPEGMAALSSKIGSSIGMLVNETLG